MFNASMGREQQTGTRKTVDAGNFRWAHRVAKDKMLYDTYLLSNITVTSDHIKYYCYVNHSQES